MCVKVGHPTQKASEKWGVVVVVIPGSHFLHNSLKKQIFTKCDFLIQGHFLSLLEDMS